MEIKICNLCAPNNGKDSSAVFNELKSEPVTPMLCNSRRLQLSYALGKNRGLWQHPPATSNHDNSGWAGCQAMARHLGLQDGWGHQHGHDAKPIYTHKTLENSTLTTASRIDFILAPNHPQALLNAPCPRCHINFNFGHDTPYWAGKGQASRPHSYCNVN